MKMSRTIGRAAGVAACTLAMVSLVGAQQQQQPQPQQQSAPGISNNNGRATANANGNHRVQLGVRIQQSPTTGVYVADVRQGSAAARAGIQPGDYLLSLNGKSISSPQDFQRLMAASQASKKATFVVWRNQAKRTLSVTFLQTTFPQTRTAGFRGEEGGTANPQLGNRETRPWLGVQVAKAKGKQGARVVAVYPSGPASFAGLESGDLITRIGNRDIKSPDDVTMVIRKMQPGKDAKIIITRDGESQTLTATLGNQGDYIPGNISMPPRNGNQTATGDFSGSMDGVPGHAMMLEQHRRFAQQHQRIEKLLLDLKKEVQELRRQVEGRPGVKNPTRPAPRGATPQP